jgi:hypothetical protein
MKFKTTIEVEVEVEYTVDQDIRQGEDARFPSEPHIDDVSYFLTDSEAVTSDVRDAAEAHFLEAEKEFE